MIYPNWRKKLLRDLVSKGKWATFLSFLLFFSFAGGVKTLDKFTAGKKLLIVSKGDNKFGIISSFGVYVLWRNDSN